jgi:membrane protease subunit HflC
MKTKSILITAIVIITLIGLNSSVFIVQEKDQVIITQFGKPVGEAITTPGLH